MNDESLTSTRVHVLRDGEGTIVSLSRVPAAGFEPVAADQPDVLAFARSLTKQKGALAESDLALIRALEDLIDVLIRKGVLCLTDLPDSVQSKLMARRSLRGSLSSLSLLDNDQDTV